MSKRMSKKYRKEKRMVAGTTAIKVPQVPMIENVIVEPISENFIMPTYASEGDSGMDVYAIEDMLIEPGATAKVRLGFKMDIPKHPFHGIGYRWEAQARPKSGNSSNTMLRVSNAPGTVDNFFKGEVCILLTNTKERDYGIAQEYDKDGELEVSLGCAISDYALNVKGNRVLNEIPVPIPEFIDDEETATTLQVLDGTYVIYKGDKVAQLVFNEVIRPMKFTIGKVGTSDRGENGFGSDVGYKATLKKE